MTHFVKAGTEMDLEASRRGTTVYLVDKSIDTSPPLLGANLCSLRPNVDRLSFSCIWERMPDVIIVQTHLCMSIIRPNASLTFGEAQVRIDDANMKDDLTVDLLNSLAKL